MPRPKQQMSKYGASASAVTTASRLGKRKLRVRIVEKSESEDSDIEDVIEQTRSISLAQEHSGRCLQHDDLQQMHLRMKNQLITS
jgi:hypothetical protein